MDNLPEITELVTVRDRTGRTSLWDSGDLVQCTLCQLLGKKTDKEQLQRLFSGRCRFLYS